MIKVTEQARERAVGYFRSQEGQEFLKWLDDHFPRSPSKSSFAPEHIYVHTDGEKKGFRLAQELITKYISSPLRDGVVDESQ